MALESSMGIMGLNANNVNGRDGDSQGNCPEASGPGKGDSGPSNHGLENGISSSLRSLLFQRAISY